VSPSPTASLRWLRICASLTLLIGLMVVAGWVMDWPWARQWLPRSMDTTMNAAVGLMVGAAGLLARSAGLRRSARFAGGFLLLLGAAVLIDLFTGGIDWISRLFWVHPESYMWVSGRMAPHSAVAFILAGIGLSLADTRWFSRDGERFAAGFVFGTGFLPLVHFAAIILFYGEGIHSRNMGLPLACGFMLLGGAQIDWRRMKKGDGTPRLVAGLSAAFITCIAVYMLVGNRLLIETNHEIAHAQEARAAINSLISRVARMESTARAYALTASSDFGNRVEVHAVEMRRELDGLPALLLPLPGKEADLEELRTLTREKIEAAEKLVNLRDTEGLTAAADFLASLPQDRSSRLVRLAAAMLSEEDSRHRRSVGMQQVLETNIRVALGAGGLMVALMMLATSLLAFQSARARQRAEHGLQEISALQRAVLDGTVLSVIATEPDGTIREFNRGAELMLGYSREEMVGRRTPEIIHVYGEVAAHAAELSARLGRRIEPGFEVFVARARDGQVDEREWTYVRKDGTRFPVQLSVTALRDSEGQITGFLGVAQDLTEKKRAQIALQASEKKLGEVLGHADCLVWEAQVTLKPDDWNWQMSVYPSGLYHRLTQQYGIEEGAGLWYRFQIPEQEAMNRVSRAAMERGDAGYVQEFRLIRDGNTTWLRETVAIRRQQDGHFWLVGVATDVTDRKLAEEALRFTEERFRSFAELAPVGICQTDDKGRCLYVNDRWCEITGRPDRDFIGKNWAMAVHPQDRRSVLKAWMGLLKGGSESAIEYRFQHPTGESRWVAGSAVPLRDPAGHIMGFLGTITDVTDRKRAAEALSKSEEQFRNAFDYAGIGMALVAPDGRMRQVNEALQNLLGYNETELLARTFQDVTHPEDVQADQGYLQELLAGRRHYFQIEKRYLHRDSRVVHVRLTVTLVRSPDGSPLHFIAQIEDITARHLAEQALIASQRQLSDVFRSMAEGLVVHDAQGRIIECNTAAEKILGLTRDQLLGLTSYDPRWQALNEDGTPCQGDRHPTSITRMTGQPQRGVVMGVHRADGLLSWVSINTEPILDEHGYLQSVVASFSDITAKRAAEEELRKLALIASRTSNAVVLTDAARRVIWVNEGFTRMTGYSFEEIQGKVPGWVLQGKDTDPAVVAHMRACLNREEGFQVEVKNYRKDGAPYWIRSDVQPIRSARGKIEYFMAIQHDITEQKALETNLAQARDEAVAASRMKSEFLANVSHEIRTPMNGVLGMAELLMDTNLTEDQRQMGRVIQSSANNLLTIIDDLLDFSKIEAGKFRLTTQEFSLAEQLEQAMALMVPRAVSGQITLQSELPDDLPARLCGDPGRIQQVLVNLLGNAVKFTERGTVTLALKPREAVVPGRFAFRVEVRDTGIGIPPDQIDRLFQPFVQADGSSTRRFGGTGLGLAISRQLIDLMGGRIGCESRPGEGSVFWFELELELATSPLAPAEPKPAVVPAQPSARLLVAEDQHANQLVMRLLLTKMGVNFKLVGDGMAVIEELSRENYSLILMDCQMPRMDGYEATRLIRTGAAGPDNETVPIVALTAHAMASDREKCLEAGMDDYLSKPVRFENLQPILQRLGIGFVVPVPEPPAPPSPPTAILDEAQLAQLRSLPGRKGPRLLDELASMALQEVPAGLAELRRQVSAQAARPAVQTAHRLAGAAANLGARKLRALLLEVEKSAEAGDWPQVRRQLDDLDREWIPVQQALSGLVPAQHA
jgi:PAS domain S-box-containing protein